MCRQGCRSAGDIFFLVSRPPHIKLDEVLAFQLRFTPKMHYFLMVRESITGFGQHSDELELPLCLSS